MAVNAGQPISWQEPVLHEARTGCGVLRGLPCRSVPTRPSAPTVVGGDDVIRVSWSPPQAWTGIDATVSTNTYTPERAALGPNRIAATLTEPCASGNSPAVMTSPAPIPVRTGATYSGEALVWGPDTAAASVSLVFWDSSYRLLTSTGTPAVVAPGGCVGRVGFTSLSAKELDPSSSGTPTITSVEPPQSAAYVGLSVDFDGDAGDQVAIDGATLIDDDAPDVNLLSDAVALSKAPGEDRPLPERPRLSDALDPGNPNPMPAGTALPITGYTVRLQRIDSGVSPAPERVVHVPSSATSTLVPFVGVGTKWQATVTADNAVGAGIASLPSKTVLAAPLVVTPTSTSGTYLVGWPGYPSTGTPPPDPDHWTVSCSGCTDVTASGGDGHRSQRGQGEHRHPHRRDPGRGVRTAGRVPQRVASARRRHGR
jgi:hypothetical protein